MRIVLLTGLLGLSALRLFATSIDVVSYDDRFGTIDDSTGAYTRVGTLPITAAGGIASMNGLLYLEDLGDNLLTVDPLTGASHLIGGTGLGVSIGAFGGGLDGLFEVDYASNLYAINATTGKATLVGATGLAVNNGAFDTSLSSDGTSLLYTAGRPGASDELYSLNIESGVATDLGTTGVTGIAGSAFVNGSLELFQYGQANDYIYLASGDSLNGDSLNFVRGAKLGAQIGAQIIDGGAASENSSIPLAPEPGSEVLLGAGLIAVALFRRLRRKAAPPELLDTTVNGTTVKTTLQ